MVRILGDDEEVSHATINKPLAAPEMDEDGAIRTVLNDLTVGTYDVTVTAGASYSTQRQGRRRDGFVRHVVMAKTYGRCRR